MMKSRSGSTILQSTVRLMLLIAQIHLSAIAQSNSALCSLEIISVARNFILRWHLLFQFTKSNQRVLGVVTFLLTMCALSISEGNLQLVRTSRQSSSETSMLRTRFQCTSSLVASSLTWTKSHSFGSKIRLRAGPIHPTADNGLARLLKTLF